VQGKWIALAGVLALAAGAGIVIARRHRVEAAKPSATPVRPAVEAAEAVLSGRVQPRTILPVGAPAEGVLEAVFVEPGQEVYENQLLGRVHNASLDEAIRQAQASLDQAQGRIVTLNSDALAAKLESSRATAEQSRAQSEFDRLQKIYERQKGLWEAGATARLAFEKSKQDYDEAKAAVARLDDAAKLAAEREKSVAGDLENTNRAVAQSQQALERAKSNQGSAELHSPADGIVFARKAQPGDKVDPSIKDLIEIATQLTSMQISLAPDPLVLVRLRPGQKAKIHIPEITPDEIAGTVREVRGNEAIVDFTSPAPVMKLDLIAQVRITF
jgi:HlyD family secretion protein